MQELTLLTESPTYSQKVLVHESLENILKLLKSNQDALNSEAAPENPLFTLRHREPIVLKILDSQYRTFFRDGTTDLIAAALIGNLEHIQTLLSEDPTSFEIADNRSFTPVYWAAAAGRFSVIHYFLSMPQLFTSRKMQDQLFSGLAEHYYNILSSINCSIEVKIQCAEAIKSYTKLLRKWNHLDQTRLVKTLYILGCVYANDTVNKNLVTSLNLLAEAQEAAALVDQAHPIHKMIEEKVEVVITMQEDSLPTRQLYSSESKRDSFEDKPTQLIDTADVISELPSHLINVFRELNPNIEQKNQLIKILAANVSSCYWISRKTNHYSAEYYLNEFIELMGKMENPSKTDILQVIKLQIDLAFYYQKQGIKARFPHLDNYYKLIIEIFFESIQNQLLNDKDDISGTYALWVAGIELFKAENYAEAVETIICAHNMYKETKNSNSDIGTLDQEFYICITSIQDYINTQQLLQSIAPNKQLDPELESLFSEQQIVTVEENSTLAEKSLSDFFSVYQSEEIFDTVKHAHADYVLTQLRENPHLLNSAGSQENLLFAARYREPAIKSMLLQHIELFGDGTTELIAATLAGTLEKVKLLVAQNPDSLQIADARGFTPIYWAAKAERFSVLYYFLLQPKLFELPMMKDQLFSGLIEYYYNHLTETLIGNLGIRYCHTIIGCTARLTKKTALNNERLAHTLFKLGIYYKEQHNDLAVSTLKKAQEVALRIGNSDLVSLIIEAQKESSAAAAVASLSDLGDSNELQVLDSFFQMMSFLFESGSSEEQRGQLIRSFANNAARHSLEWDGNPHCAAEYYHDDFIELMTEIENPTAQDLNDVRQKEQKIMESYIKNSKESKFLLIGRYFVFLNKTAFNIIQRYLSIDGFNALNEVNILLNEGIQLFQSKDHFNAQEKFQGAITRFQKIKDLNPEVISIEHLFLPFMEQLRAHIIQLCHPVAPVKPQRNSISNSKSVYLYPFRNGMHYMKRGEYSNAIVAFNESMEKYNYFCNTDPSIFLENPDGITEIIAMRSEIDQQTKIAWEKWKLNEQTETWGFKAKDVAGDGNCLFHAVIEQIAPDHKILGQSTAVSTSKDQLLRQQVVDHINENRSLYSKYMSYDSEDGAKKEKEIDQIPSSQSLIDELIENADTDSEFQPDQPKEPSVIMIENQTDAAAVAENSLTSCKTTLFALPPSFLVEQSVPAGTAEKSQNVDNLTF